MDVARAMAKIGIHPDSDGHDFELFGDNTFKGNYIKMLIIKTFMYCFVRPFIF